MKISRNKLLATALIVTTVLTIFGVSRFQLGATEYIGDDYCWVEGVLHNDTYALYPYAQESLDLGFSKYGEMIGYDPTTGIGVGLQYPGYDTVGTYDQRLGTSVDPFANEEVDVSLWVNGWFIDIKYMKVGPGGGWREIWAFALFSDGSLHGGDWVELVPDWEVDWDDPIRPLWQEYPPYASADSDAYPSPKPSYGGRKTNGICETDPIEIVYNGPRKFVALLKTRIKDGATPLVDVIFTIIFNKAEKNVIVLKDIKRLYDKQPLNIAFGNRGEWDLSPPAYVHFYTDEPVQCWDVDGDGGIDPIDEGHEFFFEYFRTYKHPKKWWQDVPEHERPLYLESELFTERKEYVEWFETQPTCYGREWHVDQAIKDHSYAVVQVVDADAEYVAAMAVWPHPEFWSVDYTFINPYPPPTDISVMYLPLTRLLEWHRWTVDNDPEQGSVANPQGVLDDRNNIWVKADDMSYEPTIPWIIYEHDFRLEMGVIDEYRMVSVYTVTDYHDADDADALGDSNELGDLSNGVNRIDREIQYQLNEIFDPWDIYDAMHKGTKRWVQFFDRDIGGHAWNGEDYYCIQLASIGIQEAGVLIPTLPVYRDGDWDAYCAFSERVLVDTGSGYELIYPGTSNYVGYHWLLDPIPTRYQPYYTINLVTGVIAFYEYDFDLYTYVEWFLPEDSIVKVLWSSEHHATVADQWDENDPFYPIDNSTFQFPLHHDIILAYKNDTEVFLIEQAPTRIYNYTETGGIDPYYNFTAGTTAYSAVLNVTYGGDIRNGTEIDVKYWNETTGWQEEKFCWMNYTWCKISTEVNKTVTEDYASFTLANPASYVEKVWYHSEKTLISGDYVFNNATQTLYMQDPVPAGQWLLVNYTVNGDKYADFFLGTGSRTAFTLSFGGPIPTEVADVGSLNVSNTEILQQIVNDTATPEETPLGIRVPKEECYWTELIGHGTYMNGTWLKLLGVWEEREWLNVTDTKERGNWIIRETDYCDYLVLDQPPLNTTTPPQELKIVFKVPSGRYEWGIVGNHSRAIDSDGLSMVTAAFKNKLIEYGIGGLDVQDTTSGPRVPWTLSDKGYLGTGRHPAIDYYDSIGRIHLCDDWCYSHTGLGMSSSWPISSSNIITVGGAPANIMSEYWNDFTNAFMTRGYPGGIDAIYPLTCWNDTYPDTRYLWQSVDSRYGHAVISTYKDKNGTVGVIIWGWTGQDTYYACRWFDEAKFWLQHINLHVTDLVLEIEYKTSTGIIRCPPIVSVVEYLGTISETVEQHCPQ